MEVHAIDPQQRLLMEVVYESLEASGLSVESLAGSRTGLYVGFDVCRLRRALEQ